MDDGVEAELSRLVERGGIEPVPIPIYEDNVIVSYEKNRGGRNYMTKLDEQTLAFIAEQSGGIYVREDSLTQARVAIHSILPTEHVEVDEAFNPWITALLFVAVIPLFILKRFNIP